MRRILILLLFIASQYVHAQQVITGIVVDASDNKPLVNASVVVLNTDSIMQQFARAGEDGKFQIKKSSPRKAPPIGNLPKI